MSTTKKQEDERREYALALDKFGPLVPHPRPIDDEKQTRACGTCGSINVVFDLPGGFFGHTSVKVSCRDCLHSMQLPGQDYEVGLLGSGWRRNSSLALKDATR